MTKNIFTANDLNDLTVEQVEGVELGIMEMIKMDGQANLTGKASSILFTVAQLMVYDGKLAVTYESDRNVYRMA